MKITKIILFIWLLAGQSVLAAPVTVPNTFSAGTPAKASEVNANFTALSNAVNNLPTPLMVYDSTGKVVGQYVYNGNGSDSAVYIRSNNLGFLVGYTNPLSVDHNWIGLQDRLFTWDGSQSFSLNMYFKSPDCTGDVYFQSPNGYMRNINTAVFTTLDNTIAYIVGDKFEYTRLFSSMSGSTCHTLVNDNVVGFVAKAIGTFDLSTLNLTPPFSVH